MRAIEGNVTDAPRDIAAVANDIPGSAPLTHSFLLCRRGQGDGNGQRIRRTIRTLRNQHARAGAIMREQINRDEDCAFGGLNLKMRTRNAPASATASRFA